MTAMNRSYLLALNLIVWLALLSAVQCWISDLNIDEDFTLRDSEFFTSSNRIVGGRNAEEGEFPSYVSLRFINRSTPHLYNYCGGVLISRRLILTAAHCVSNHPTDINAARTIMHPGKWNNYNVNMMRVDRICYDKRYSGLKSLALDFGLLRLRDDADIDESQIAKLPTEPIKNRQKGLNVGIGVVGSKNNKLVKADQLKVLKVEQTKCPSKWKVIHYSHVCFKSTADDKGNSCRGDSGGPIYSRNSKGEDVVVAVTSHGSGDCAKGRAFSVYTDTHKIIDMIRGYMEVCMSG